MSTKFFTNEKDNSLINKFEGIFKHMQSIYAFDALVGYFRASGYFKIRPFIDKVPKVRILVGINVDKLIQKYHAKGQLYLKGVTETKQQFFDDLKDDIQNAHYTQEVEEGILQFIDDIITEKVEIKAYPDKNLHAKIYIFRPEIFNEHTHASVITGSSNLSHSGLGGHENANYEFNVLLNDYDDVKFATDEFEKLWSDAVDVLPADIGTIKKQTYLNAEVTPYELYIKLLIEYFNTRIDYDPTSIDLLLPDSYKKLTYQAEASIEGYDKLMKYNGFFLADVVGLGKTVIASIIAKKFVFENGYHSKILVVFPPALERNWKRTFSEFQLSNNSWFISTGSLKKVLDGTNEEFPNANEFDLIIIDEAHKFRNDTSSMYEKLQTITKTDRKIPGKNGDYRKKVMLLTATPLNNHPADIENQIYLFQDKRSANLPKVKDLQGFFKPLKEKYNDLKDQKELDIKQVKEIFDEIRDKVVEPLVIRRTRTDITNNEDYLNDIKQQNIVFPSISPPAQVMYEFDENLSSLFDETILYITNKDENGNEYDGIQYWRYRAIEALMPELQKMYGNARQVSLRLSAIMKTLLVKRLESSFYAFKMSLKRLQQNTQNMIEMFEQGKIFIAPDVDVNKYLNEGKEEELESVIQEIGGNNQAYSTEDFRGDFVGKLKSDKAKIDYLVNKWNEIDYDPKLDKFLTDIKGSFLSKKVNHEGKLVVFSESKETTAYLNKHLSKAGFKGILSVNADNRKELEPTIQANFDANLQKDEWEDDFSIILTTEVLAEGINLHRSNVIVNYDVPWNSTRLMQRIGRVNRIGTEAEQVYIFNFYPTDKAENQIKLTNTALKKLQAFHSAFGEDSQIYSQLEEVGEAGLYGSKLREEINETLLYLQELRSFRKEHAQWYNKIKNLPQKTRITRDSCLVNYDAPIQASTISYIKSKDHPGAFYLVDRDSIVKELSFIEAVTIFKTNENEVAKSLPQSHHDQINSALQYFTREIKLQNIKKVKKIELSPAEKRVIPKVEYYKDHTKVDFYKGIFERTLKELLKGTHRQLANDIDNFFNESKKAGINDPSVVETNLYEQVLSKYNFSLENENTEVVKTSFAIPEIVLSESYI